MNWRAPLTATYLLLFAAAWLLYLPADARMHYPARGHRIVPGAAVTPPLDGFTAASGAYGFRKLRSAYAGMAVKLQRVDLATQDIGFLGCTGFTGCPIDVAAATAFCTTACGVMTWYDQSGNGLDLVQATAANQPAYVAACNGTRPCLRNTTSTMGVFTVASVTPATGVVTLNAVSRRTAGTSSCVWFREDGTPGNRMTSSNGAASWVLSPGAGPVVAASENAFHAGVGVINGASSLINVDGVEATGTVTGVITAGTAGVTNIGAATCDTAEAIYWDNYVTTPAQRAALVANQGGYWPP